MTPRTRILIAIASVVSLSTAPARAALTWIQATSAAGWTRGGHAAVVHDGRLWVLGGGRLDVGGNANDVWSSTNGANWTRVTPAAPWSARQGIPAIEFDGRMWIMGGGAGGAYFRDVWYSNDGVSWTMATGSAGWAGRNYFPAVVFDGRIWILGGQGTNTSDVWYSTNGAAWTRAPASRGMGQHFPVIVKDDSLWLFGGGCCANDVWKSTDGAAWSQVTAAAPWFARTLHTGVLFDGRMWIMGGVDVGSGPGATGVHNDVWCTTNGVNWTQDTAAANWSARHFHASVIFDRKVWIVGGAVGGSEVWYAEGECDRPTITAHPGSQVICDGKALQFTVAAQGSPPLEYQWRAGGVGIPGATADTYTIDSALETDGGNYDVVISNPCGSVISDAATAVVWPTGDADINGDGASNGLDIGAFVTVLLTAPAGPAAFDFCASDMNADGTIDDADISLFATVLLGS